MLEGPWQGDIVVVGFPSRVHACAWYASRAYQAILPLRTGNAQGSVVLVDGVKDGRPAVDLLSRMDLDNGAAPPP